MASINCIRGLVRPALPRAPRIQPVLASWSPFSTSAAAMAKAPQAKARQEKKGYRKKTTAQVVKRAAPGERKAFRKRIQLSNNSALPVEGHGELEAGTMLKAENMGKMAQLPDKLQDKLRTMDAFKTTQPWGLFRKPHFLVRKETVELMSKLANSAEEKKALRYVMTGSKLSGKSMMVLQAMSHAFLNNWVVIHIPEGQDLTNGQTDYAPIPDTKPLQFSHPNYCFKLIQNIRTANREVLEGLKVQLDWPNITGLQKGDSLSDLILSVKEAEFAWPTLSALWKELTLPGRPPILMTLDGLAHINIVSEFRDPSFNKVHSHDFTLIRMFLDALSGKTPLPNGGAVIAATSESNTRYPESQKLVLSQLEAGQAGTEMPVPDPYNRNYDERIYDALKDTYVMRLEGVSKDETRVLMEYWAASGLVRGVVDSRTVAETWAVGARGLVGEMERTALLTMRM